jgi:hypothetical protein
VKRRPTAWLLTLLLGVAGCFGVPAPGSAIPRASFSVVWPDKSLHKQAPKQEIAESGEAAGLLAADSQPVIPKDDAPAPSALLDPSLFQRPPPSIS